MKKYAKTLTLAIVFSFVWGVIWGLYSVRRENQRLAGGPEVRVLASTGFFTADFLAYFQKKYQVNFILTEKDTEIELLREALSENKNYDLIQIHSFMSESFALDNVFVPLEKKQMSNLKGVSVDFTQLSFDSNNNYLVPLTWGLNGFIIDAKKVSLQTESLIELLAASNKAAVLSSPVEIFRLASKLKPILSNWVETGQTTELANELKGLHDKFKNFEYDPREKVTKGEYLVAQTTNGQVANLVGQGSPYRFVLPKERSTLWVNLIGVSHGTKNIKRSMEVLNNLLLPEVNRILVKHNEQATTIESLNTSTLPLLQKAQFIRQVPLSRVEFFINHEALEPVWLQAVRKEFNLL